MSKQFTDGINYTLDVINYIHANTTHRIRRLTLNNGGNENNGVDV